MDDVLLLLPSHSTVRCQDRFDLCDSTEDEVPFWELFVRLLNPPLTAVDGLVDVLDTIAISLRGTADTDHQFFHDAFVEYWHTAQLAFFHSVWPVLRSLALELPELFPTNVLASLAHRNSRIVLSRRQVACLIVHQFLCTLSRPQWMTDGSQDFHIWYSSRTPQPKAVKAYLFSLFHYFHMLADPSNSSPLKYDVSDWPIVFSLRVLAADHWPVINTDVGLIPPNIIDTIDGASTAEKNMLAGLPNGASVISANKDVGFGRTASQEEMVVGCSPELCVVVLFQPTLRDEEVLVVEGAQAMISMTGYARSAQLQRYLDLDYEESTWRQSKWRHRTVLFMDALELDSYDADEMTPDLLPGHVDRELKKAYTAFSYLTAHYANAPKPVVTGLWGCRSFGGNKDMKTLIQWVAASLARVKLLFVCTGDENKEFVQGFWQIVDEALASDCKADQILDFLYHLTPEDQATKHVFSSLRRALSTSIDLQESRQM